MANELNPNGAGLKLKDLVYYANYENVQLTAEQQAEFDAAGRPELNYYSRLSVKDITSTFELHYVGPDRMFKRAKTRDIEFSAQQGVKQLAYDTSKVYNAIEVELNPSMSIPLPQDFVSLRFVKVVDGLGNANVLSPERRAVAATQILQEENFDYIYKEDGSLLEGEQSMSIERWKAQQNVEDERNFTIPTNVPEDFFFDATNNRASDRFGIDPRFATINGTYIIDELRGLIHLNSQYMEGDVCIIEYISDGLSNASDLSKVLVHKFDEEAIYAIIKRDLAEIFSHPDRARLKQNAAWEIRQAKHRNTDWSAETWNREFRGITKWIKH